MGFFLALFAKVEQLCGRFFFSFERKLLVTANNKKKGKKNPKPKYHHHQKNLNPFQSCTWKQRWGGGVYTLLVLSIIILLVFLPRFLGLLLLEEGIQTKHPYCIF